MSTSAELRVKFSRLWPLLDERTRRLMAASEAQSLGYGGVSLVSRACGLSRKSSLFSFISSNRRGEPLVDYETIVNLISRTSTAKGLRVICRLDRRKYATGRNVTAEQMKQINLHPDEFHGEWNYVIKPRVEK